MLAATFLSAEADHNPQTTNDTSPARDAVLRSNADRSVCMYLNSIWVNIICIIGCTRSRLATSLRKFATGRHIWNASTNPPSRRIRGLRPPIPDYVARRTAPALALYRNALIYPHQTWEGGKSRTCGPRKPPKLQIFLERDMVPLAYTSPSPSLAKSEVWP